jgi:hypothetical protein
MSIAVFVDGRGVFINGAAVDKWLYTGLMLADVQPTENVSWSETETESYRDHRGKKFFAS